MELSMVSFGTSIRYCEVYIGFHTDLIECRIKPPDVEVAIEGKFSLSESYKHLVFVNVPDRVASDEFTWRVCTAKGTSVPLGTRSWQTLEKQGTKRQGMTIFPVIEVVWM
ncbi:hypothetical protein GOBAR_AA15073 [Gossypium barbadense]|uniref:Uncharacterized protein n=1 Tax=Gossypium barbadense TaxID=3634 RepID=A0A2P5XQF6_GOSBA|nr:hypothetical protein GOBAR_AA15073 [Gossypium barbadense]